MKLTTKTRYGMRAVGMLAKNYKKGPLSAAKISKGEGISITYLEQILNKLKNKGIVKSVRGPQGGYTLARSPVGIKLYELVDILEGDVSVVFCISDKRSGKKCFKMSGCATRKLWKKINEAIETVLNSFSVADMCEGKIK